MSRSPLSPVGKKRMRTMGDSNSDDENTNHRDQEILNHLQSQQLLQNSDSPSSNPSRHPSVFMPAGISGDATLCSLIHKHMLNVSLNPLQSDTTTSESDTGEVDMRLFQDSSVASTSSMNNNDSSGSLSSSVGSSSNYDRSDSSDFAEVVGAEIIEDEEFDSGEDEFMGYESEEDTIDHSLPHEYLKHDPTPETQYPKPDWITVTGLLNRKYGCVSRDFTKRADMHWFERYVNNSLWMIQRLELSKRLEEHTGSINCLNFNSTGNLLCSGSDDLNVCIWDWQLNKLRKKINTGHMNNVYHSEFCNNNSNIITASRDGSVRLIDIEIGLSEQLISQSGEIGKLAFMTPQTLVACGTNACVNFLDLRIRKPTKLFIVRNPKNNRSCALHSINTHPMDKHKIVVAGASPYVFLYDLRRVARNPYDLEHKPLYCIDNLENTTNIVTSTAFNSIGDKLLISYNDDDLFVCETDTCQVIHRYKGHRNKKTIKECSWFGDNFVLSGSDDGHIYGWDLESEHIVCFLEGDVKGVVNCLHVHPSLPVLASSGLDHNVKVWEPISKIWPQTLKGIKPQICKNTMRRKRAQERRNQVFQHFDDDSLSDMDL